MKRDEMFSALTSNLKAEIKELDGTTIRETDDPRELWVNSLQIMEAITQTMDQLGIKVPREDLLQARDLGDVLDLFERSAGR